MNNRNFLILTSFFYFILRLFSFYFPPEISLINTCISIFVLLAIGYWLIAKPQIGWLLVASELVLGGSGNFLSIGPIALRTALLFASLSIWKIQKLRSGKLFDLIKSEKYFLILSSLILLVVTFGALNGYLGNHNLKAIYSDVIPYFFIFYYFPLKELLTNAEFKDKLINLLVVSVVCGAIFSLLTLVLFSSQIFVLQDSYYHWFRDIAGGKITDLGDDYFRIVLNENLVMFPILLLFAFLNNLTPKTTRLIVITSILAIYAVNLTRGYLLGLVAAFALICLFKRSWSAIKTAILAILGLVLIFSVIHSLASRSHTLGLEFFGLRLGSIVAPKLEDSSLSRLLLLPKIIDKISTRPILGTGLGDTITVFSPVVKQTITTTQFDWGFLEIQSELGIIGSLMWLIFLGTPVYYFLKNKNIIGLAVLAFFAVATITSPALLHVLGIVTIAVLYATTLPVHTRS